MSDSVEELSKKLRVLRQDLETTKRTLEEPLTEKQVMVPITTKGFFSGTLKPSIKDGQEQVLVKMGSGNLVELDRSQAIDHLDGRIQSLLSPSVATAPTNGKAKESLSSEEHSLPFFEIREELDESGKEVKAEAINVAKQLELLQKKEGKDTNASSIVPTASADDEVIDEQPEKRKTMTDTEYEELSSRLDMLARLEEEAEATKAENQASAKKLQSKGWSKGFLNAKPKKKKAKPKKEAHSTPGQPSSQGRKVAFQSQDQIREIPRVGERSASELKSSPAMTTSRREIEPQVFSGVIRERPVDLGSKAADSPSKNPPARKKLSRFAQERLDQQR